MGSVTYNAGIANTRFLTSAHILCFIHKSSQIALQMQMSEMMRRAIMLNTGAVENGTAIAEILPTPPHVSALSGAHARRVLWTQHVLQMFGL